MSNQLPYALLAVPIDVPRITSTKEASTFNYYGSVESSLQKNASKFLTGCIGRPEKEMEPVIKAFLHATQTDCAGCEEQKKACWLTIRVTERSNAFEIPRWHQDGKMYPYDKGHENLVRSKYGLTLFGPPTLILKPYEHVFAKQRKGEAQHYRWQETNAPEPSEEEIEDAEAKLREWLASEFKNAPRVQIGHGEVVRFSWGRDDSPVHSEPDLISDRIFMTVLYGSESEVRRMCEWRNTEYGKYSVGK